MFLFHSFSSSLSSLSCYFNSSIFCSFIRFPLSFLLLVTSISVSELFPSYLHLLLIISHYNFVIQIYLNLISLHLSSSVIFSHLYMSFSSVRDILHMLFFHFLLFLLLQSLLSLVVVMSFPIFYLFLSTSFIIIFFIQTFLHLYFDQYHYNFLHFIVSSFIFIFKSLQSIFCNQLHHYHETQILRFCKKEAAGAV